VSAIGWRASLHDRVVRAIRDGVVSVERVQALRVLVARGQSSIDYSNYSLEHVYAYYWVNYAKVRHACRDTDFRPAAGEPFLAIDLGAGSGPGTAAVVDYLRDDVGFPGPLSMAVVEPCLRQLELFSAITGTYLEERGVEWEVLSLSDALRARPSFVVASYVLSELEAPARECILMSIAECAGAPGLDLLVVDEAKATVFEEARAAHSWPAVIAPTPARIELPAELAPPNSLKKSYTLAAILCRSLLWRKDPPPQSLELYRHAWERNDTTAIQRLFGPRSTYEISPDRVLNGQEEILHYWKRNSATQRDVRFVVDRWATHGPLVLADWSASFRRVDLDRNVHLKGSMSIRMSGDRIDRFVEYYSKRLA